MMVRLEAGGHPVHCRPLHYYSIDKDGTESVSVCATNTPQTQPVRVGFLLETHAFNNSAEFLRFACHRNIFYI